MSPDEPLTPFLPTDLGPFRLLETLGTGGHGKVYLGERREGFQQRVAIKLLYATDQAPLREQTLLASLEHPNIVRLLDQGMTDQGMTDKGVTNQGVTDQGVTHQGRHYLVMEYIAGPPIDEFCNNNRLSAGARLKLIRKVMEGVSFAHRRLIVHADLKPSNILIDPSGEPRLLDFGIATLLDEDRASSVPTFTPAFASPEQRMQQSVTIASDVYALGVLCALLLTGGVPLPELEASLTPGTALLGRANAADRKRIAAERSTSPSALRRALSGDLDAILAKALKPNPEERYPSVEAFSEDIQAHLDNRTIKARHATLIERMQKWVQRHWALAAAALFVSASILISVVGVTVQTARTEYQRRLAQNRLQELVRLTAALDGELYASVKSLPRSDAAQRSLLDSATHTLDKLANSRSGDTALSEELAAEYIKLGRLELGQELARPEKAPGTPNEREQHSRALGDAHKAISVLQQLPEGVRSSSQVKQQIADAMALQQSVP